MPDSKRQSFSVYQLAKLLDCPYKGKGSTKIHGVASLEDAKTGELVFLANPKFRDQLERTKASAAIIPADEKFDRIPVIKSKNPHLSFIQAVNHFHAPYLPAPGIHPTAYVSPYASVGKDVSVGAFTFIGEGAEIGKGTVLFPLVNVYPRTKIGRHCIIHSHVCIREDSRIGNRVILHSGAVIGSDGFGYFQDKKKMFKKIPQIGGVIIEDFVEVGANTTIDRASLGKTIIKKGTKIDNLVQIAHNVEIGANTIIAAQTGVAGSSKIAKNVIAAGQVGIADHVKIGDNVIIAAKTGITKDVPANTMVAGIPHLNIKDWRKAWASIPQLYDLLKEVKKLKKKIQELEKKSRPSE
jgi:UDP-3-O-[3-hydroxymyristoyl] glucosamine N-acyltransferase